MSELQTNIRMEQLSLVLDYKRKLYNEMINEEKEFEIVKILFLEIRELEKQVGETTGNHRPRR